MYCISVYFDKDTEIEHRKLGIWKVHNKILKPIIEMDKNARNDQSDCF